MHDRALYLLHVAFRSSQQAWRAARHRTGGQSLFGLRAGRSLRSWILDSANRMTYGPRLVLGALMLVASGVVSAASKLAPELLADALHARSESILHIIVRGAPTGLEAARKLAKGNSDAERAQDLPLVDGVFLALKESDAEILAGRTDISQVYYIRGELADTYFHIIQGLAYAWTQVPTPGIVNMSLGPEASIMPVESQTDEPMNVATRKLADKGLVVVIAAGNYYVPDSPNPGVINPWCRVEWVICVGAASADATALYKCSARGLATDPTTWPDVLPTVLM